MKPNQSALAKAIGRPPSPPFAERMATADDVISISSGSSISDGDGDGKYCFATSVLLNIYI